MKNETPAPFGVGEFFVFTEHLGGLVDIKGEWPFGNREEVRR